MPTRRTILKSGAAAATIASVPRPLFALFNRRPEPVPAITDPNIKRLCGVSLDAARSAGATYADVRLNHTFIKRIGSPPPELESMTFGVRVLADGHWGFAASPVWSIDEAARLARAAVRNAKANTFGTPRLLELAPMTQVESGHWETPIKDDAFAIDRAEILDLLGGVLMFIDRQPGVTPQGASAEFIKQQKAFASTLDQYCTQILYQTSGSVSMNVMTENARGVTGLDTLSPAGVGFEYFRDQPLREQILRTVEEMKEDLSLPVKPVDVGRYNVILDAWSVGQIVGQSIGSATQLDRALGYEANAGGTSYLKDPSAMVGTFKIGSPNVTVTANRSERGGAATVKWDDEGVMPKDFTLVKDGILTDMQTNREAAVWLKDYYTRRQQPIASNGCAYAPNATFAPLIHSANLQLQPSGTDATFQSLIANEPKGIVVKHASTYMDFQQITGYTIGNAFEIKDGKRVARLHGAGLSFRTPEFWNSIIALGGTASRRSFGAPRRKGEPGQDAYHSFTTVPVVAKDLTVIDVTRKA